MMGLPTEMRPVERSLYHPILKYLEDLGFVGIQEIKKGSDFFDILFMSGRNSFILEAKVERKDGTDPIINGIVQAYRYGLNFGTKNLLVISYPTSTREDMRSIQELDERTLKTKVDAVILTENWCSYETKLTTEEVLSNLKAKIEQKLSDTVRVETASIVIQRGVKILSRLISKYYTDDASIFKAADHLTINHGLFIKLDSSGVKKSRIRIQTVDLLAYILVNQILFYFLYSKKSQEFDNTRKVSELRPIRHVGELNEYFDQLRNIDYRPIFDIFVASLIPSNEEIVSEVNKLIECLTPLQISEMKHDMYGRLIGRYLPKETRKVLASYYTKTSSADLLANLTIDNYSDTVWDFACGSGTLLVSSYDRKMKLYRDEKRLLEKCDEDKLHVKFVEQEITGTDIMPFACHLSGLSLSAKNLGVLTDFLRISVMNALDIDSKSVPFTIEEARGDISKELEQVHNPQPSMDTYIKPRKQVATQSRVFQLEKVDRVVINPPFTSINKLPDNYRLSFGSSTVSRICGRRIHLWGYFLALTDKILKDGGKIGTIIPISLLHGKDTQKLREYYLSKYSIEYIIKPVVGKPFSEDSIFTDIIFIARKTLPTEDHRVRIVCLREDINESNTVAVEALARHIKTDLEDLVDNGKYLSFKVDQRQLMKNSENLMSYVFTNSGDLKKAVESIVDKLRSNQMLRKLDNRKLEDGYQLRPKGTVTHSVITRNYPVLKPSPRAKDAVLSFEKDDDSPDSLKYYNKEKDKFEVIQKYQLVTTLRTLTGIDTLDATNLTDYLLRQKSVVKEKAHLFVLNRFWLKSTGLFLTAAYVEEPSCPLNMFMMYKCGKTEAKILSLYFNSIFYMVQALMFTKQSTRGYMELKQIDLSQFIIPDVNKLSNESRDRLEAFFEANRHRKLESIPAQLSTMTDYRLSLDGAIAESLGMRTSKDELSRIYRLVWDHINNLP